MGSSIIEQSTPLSEILGSREDIGNSQRGRRMVRHGDRLRDEVGRLPLNHREECQSDRRAPVSNRLSAIMNPILILGGGGGVCLHVDEERSTSAVQRMLAVRHICKGTS